MPKQQKARAKKTSNGVHGGGGRMPHLNPVQKVLLGGGQLRTIKRKISAKDNAPEVVKQTPAKEFLNSIRDCEAV